MNKNLSPLGFIALLWNERHDVASRRGYVFAPSYDECYALMSAELAAGDYWYGVTIGRIPVPIESLEGFDWSIGLTEMDMCL